MERDEGRVHAVLGQLTLTLTTAAAVERVTARVYPRVFKFKFSTACRSKCAGQMRAEGGLLRVQAFLTLPVF